MPATVVKPMANKTYRVLSETQCGPKPQPRNTGTKPQGFSESELAQFHKVDKILAQVYKTEKSVESSILPLYITLSSLYPFPASSTLGKALGWISSGFGLFSSKQTAKREKAQEEISDKVKQLKSLHTSSMHEKEEKIRRKHSGTCFVMDKNTPEILKRVAIPASKDPMCYEVLRNSIEYNSANKSNPNIKIDCPSAERTIIYRQRPNKSWESLELSWRRPGKVDVIKNGVVLGSLYNDDALKGALGFINGLNVHLTKKDYPSDTLWKVV